MMCGLHIIGNNIGRIMNRKLISCFIAIAFLLSACGDDFKDNVTGKTYTSVGIFEDKNPKIEYKISIGAIFWSVIFSETIIIPILLVGFDLWYPVGYKDINYEPGVIPSYPLHTSGH